MINEGLDYTHCKGCLRCVDVCPTGALVSGQEREQSHSVKEMFDLSKEGQYRFKTDCYVYLTEEESQSCELWAEFTLSTTK